MKSLFSLCLVIVAVSASSCNKCYTCKSGVDAMEVCKGDAYYELAKNGGNFTDDQGNNLYKCD